MSLIFPLDLNKVKENYVDAAVKKEFNKKYPKAYQHSCKPIKREWRRIYKKILTYCCAYNCGILGM